MGRMDFGVCSQATPVPSKRRMWEGVQPMVDWMCVCVYVCRLPAVFVHDLNQCLENTLLLSMRYQLFI